MLEWYPRLAAALTIALLIAAALGGGHDRGFNWW